MSRFASDDASPFRTFTGHRKQGIINGGKTRAWIAAGRTGLSYARKAHRKRGLAGKTPSPPLM